MKLLAAPILAFVLLLTACSSDSPTKNEDPPLGDPIAFVNVTVVPMRSKQPMFVPHQTVIVQGDRITTVAPAALIDLHPDTVIIDGSGRFLVPGLVDMHTHVRGSDLQKYLDHGITSVRCLWGYVGLQETAQDILNGDLAGPAVYSVSPGLDGSPPSWPQTQLIESPGEAASVVQKQVDDGWPALKMYQNLRSDVFDAVVVAAKERDIPFGGHVPHRVGLQRCLNAGYLFIEHLSGYEVALGNGTRGYPGWITVEESRIPGLAAATKAAGTWNCPTLAIFLALGQNLPAGSFQAMRDNRRNFVGALHEAECPLLIGTDSGIDVVEAGASMHDEMDEFRAAGLSNYQTLRLATWVAAGYLGQSPEFGLVEENMRADLLLLDADPLEDPSALRKRVGTMVRGEWLPQE